MRERSEGGLGLRCPAVSTASADTIREACSRASNNETKIRELVFIPEQGVSKD